MKRLAEPQKAVLKLKRVYFDEINYVFGADEDANFEYKFEFEKTLKEINDNHFRIYLRCKAVDEKNEVQLNIEVVGEFECELENEEFKTKLLNENAIAILFPYLRSQICLVTTQPSAFPINLPAINIVSLFEEKE